MNKLLTIKEASELLNVTTSTLRRWEREGKLVPDERTKGNQRRYKLSSIRPEKLKNRKTVAYARVSSNEQKEDLNRQKNILELFCASNGWSFELISDLGSSLNYKKKGLQKLIKDILNDKVERLVITHKDRLLRFGAELIFQICEEKNIEITIINQSENSTFEEDLAKDVLEIMTVFSAELYGSRSEKNTALLQKLKEVEKLAKQNS
ncbi:putative site-specific integrase-resolvase [Thiovulum sp. ES]|nr:putative site-specific integrase-resolvase [Thiovulum sp. ES]